MISANTPVIVGAGQITERLEDSDYRGLSNVELAAEAARRACADAGGLDMLAGNIDTIGTLRTFEHSTPQYSTPFGKSNNFPHSIARRIGVEPRLAVWAKVGGDTPQTLTSEFCEKIAAGSIGMALLVGAEAISTARHLAAENKSVDWSEEIDAPLDDRGLGLKGLRMRYATQHKILGGPDSYALLENARRARLGLSREDYRQQQIAQLFAPFSQVAAENPYSTAPVAYSAEELATVTERNRMIADPYTRLLVARDQVNQAAALVITSAGKARELGIPESRWVYLHGYAQAQERPIQLRDELGRALSAQLACRAALDAAGIEVEQLSYLDLYSCFPIAVSNVCDALGIAADDPRGLTVTGGLPYFGGPGNSYSMHAIATMVERLRENPGSYGLIGANGGQLSKYAAGVYSTREREFRACDSRDIQAQVDALPELRLAFEADGRGTIETYTVVYGRQGPSHGIVVGRLESGERFYANTTDGDDETLQSLVDEDPLGREIFVRSFGFGNRFAFSEQKLTELFPPKPPRLRDDYKFMLVERRGRVLEITMNRPEMRNALHPPAHEELDEIFDAFFADPELWVAILTGAGKESFTAGNDLKYSAKHPVYLPKTGFAALTRRGGRTKPVIAAVNGYAMGGGLEICMACDLVVADARSQFGLSEVKVGLVAGEGGLVRLPRRVPPMLANEMILTGKRLNAEQALAVGLINRIAADGEALQGARELADEILESSPTSVRLALQIMRDTESIPDELAAVRWKHPAIDELMSSEDATEGPRAFAEKRKPQWKNR